MVHSPLTKTIHQPCSNVNDWKRGIASDRVRAEEDGDGPAVEDLLKDCESLIEQWEFLETKLDLKVCIYLSFSRGHSGPVG